MIQADMQAAPENLAPSAGAPVAAARPLFRRLLSDAVRVFCGQTAATVATILAGIVIVRVLGPAGKGALAFSATIVTLLTTAFSGVTTAAVIAIARGHTERPQAERATLRAALVAGVGAALVLVPLGLVTQRSPLIWAAAAAAPALVAASAVMLLQYRGRIAGAIGVQQIGSTGAALTGAVVVLLGGGIAGAFACWIAALVLAALGGRRRLGHAEPLARPGGGAALARIGVTTTALAVVAYLNLTVDVYIVAGSRSAVELGLYTLGIASGEMLWELGRSLVWPALGPIADLPREEAAVLVTRLFRQITLVVGLAALAAWFAGPLAIRLVYGERFAASGEILRTILPGIVAMAAELPLGSFVLLALGKARALLALQVASTLACAAICVLGLPRYGLVAAAFATSVTYCGVFATVLALAMRGGISLRALVALGRSRG
jgi:O-antigen/teichoic acid export membrane protein